MQHVRNHRRWFMFATLLGLVTVIFWGTGLHKAPQVETLLLKPLGVVASLGLLLALGGITLRAFRGVAPAFIITVGAFLGLEQGILKLNWPWAAQIALATVGAIAFVLVVMKKKRRF